MGVDGFAEVGVSKISGLSASIRRCRAAFVTVVNMAAALFCCDTALCAQAGDATDRYIGLYRTTKGQSFAISPTDFGDGEMRLLFTDFQTGATRILTRKDEKTLSAGPSLLQPTPVQMTFGFDNSVPGASWTQENGTAITAQPVGVHREDIQFVNRTVRLSGTLYLPPGKGPFPAIILLHGSGALNRLSFGPYPYFFASCGLAVLVYDQRGAGRSTGDWKRSTYDDLADDALAGMRALQTRRDIRRERIGLWGTSHGGRWHCLPPLAQNRSRLSSTNRAPSSRWYNKSCTTSAPTCWTPGWRNRISGVRKHFSEWR